MNNENAEHIFLGRFQMLSDLLLDDNFTNMRNLNQTSHNINEIFSILKGIIRHLTQKYHQLHSRNQELEEELQKIDPTNHILIKRQ